MPIVVACSCGKKLRARDDQAGRECRCPSCGQMVFVPYPVARAIDPPDFSAPAPAADPEIPTQWPPPPKPSKRKSVAPQQPQYIEPPPYFPPPQTTIIPARKAVKLPDRVVPGPLPSVDEEVKRREQSWRAHVYWVMLIFILPLIFVTVSGKPDLEQLINKTLEKYPALKEKFDDQKNYKGFEALDEALHGLPGHRLEGAAFARETWAHWPIAVVATLVWFLIVAVAIPSESAEPKDLFLAGLFTSTIGVAILLTFQYFGGCCCIGIWYMAALHPDAPFGPSLLGFVFGVGVCEEVTKCIPVLWKLRREYIGWREACLIGMASGAGFGISEGIHYCTTFYNGITGADIYVERFLSCIAFHVMLSGCCGILIFRKQKFLAEWKDPIDWLLLMTAILIVPIFLHGLFDTFLKKHMDAGAIVAWLACFGWLAWLIHDSRMKEIRASQIIQSGPKLIKTHKGTRLVQ